VAERAADIAQIATNLRQITNPRMSSDLTTSIALAKAALTGALANVEVNLESLESDGPNPPTNDDASFMIAAKNIVAALKSDEPS